MQQILKSLLLAICFLNGYSVCASEGPGFELLELLNNPQTATAEAMFNSTGRNLRILAANMDIIAKASSNSSEAKDLLEDIDRDIILMNSLINNKVYLIYLMFTILNNLNNIIFDLGGVRDYINANFLRGQTEPQKRFLFFFLYLLLERSGYENSVFALEKIGIDRFVNINTFL